jgi:hypothetical protein
VQAARRGVRRRGEPAEARLGGGALLHRFLRPGAVAAGGGLAGGGALRVQDDARRRRRLLLHPVPILPPYSLHPSPAPGPCLRRRPLIQHGAPIQPPHRKDRTVRGASLTCAKQARPHQAEGGRRRRRRGQVRRAGAAAGWGNKREPYRAGHNSGLHYVRCAS